MPTTLIAGAITGLPVFLTFPGQQPLRSGRYLALQFAGTICRWHSRMGVGGMWRLESDDPADWRVFQVCPGSGCV